MPKKTTKAENTNSEISKCNHDESNDLQDKIVNKNEFNINKSSTDGYSSLNLNIDEKNVNKEDMATLAAEPSGSSLNQRRSRKKVSYCPPGPPSPEKTCSKEDVATLTAEACGSSSRPRRRSKPVSYCPPRSPSPESQPRLPAKKMRIRKISTLNNKRSRTDELDEQSRDSNTSNYSLEDNCEVEDNESNTEKIASCAAIALEKLKFDIELDPNVVDKYTDTDFNTEGAEPESPETRRERIDIISRQCRLHPANKKYNQGPIENPPLIQPEKKVGYTPGGQRHEVDLNFDRPKRFNSEYEQLQWDYATIVNVSRMFGDLETGDFLPDGLDPNVERRHIAEQEMATNLAIEHFGGIARASPSCGPAPQFYSPPLSEEEKEHLRLLEVENELIELNKYAVVRLQDFAVEIDRKLRKICNLTLTPIMIKKNPTILDTLETLATQCFHIEVVLAARALLDKIKDLFEVPEDQEFREFFDAEVEKLKEKTKEMTAFDILMMTEEPPDEPDDSASLTDTDPELTQSGEELSSESEVEWIPIENTDVWIDVHQDAHVVGLSSVNSEIFDLINDLEDDDTNDESEDSLSELSNSDDEDETELDFSVGMFISGMPIIGSYTVTVTFSYFEYI